MAQMGTDIRGRTHRKDAGSPHPAYGHPLPIGWGEGLKPGAAGKATLAHRMGEGLGVRAHGIDICVHPRNLRSTPSGVSNRRWRRWAQIFVDERTAKTPVPLTRPTATLSPSDGAKD